MHLAPGPVDVHRWKANEQLEEEEGEGEGEGEGEREEEEEVGEGGKGRPRQARLCQGSIRDFFATAAAHGHFEFLLIIHVSRLGKWGGEEALGKWIDGEAPGRIDVSQLCVCVCCELCKCVGCVSVCVCVCVCV